ncbi:type IV secretory system conjugative DNA transfer family protein [Metamycoplasma equirhinis]|uniref:type IV secretory system conjugative DNA transfer family protein n=1 Tax=Metamycoplasma equirhinis TaxID=92402 RepID=UPI0035946E6D
MQNNKNNTEKILKNVLSYTFSLVIWPILAFFLLAALMLIINSKQFQLILLWFTKKRDFLSDILLFWKINTKLRNIAILLIFFGSLLLIIVFNWKFWFKSIKNKFVNKTNELKNNWEINQFTNEGNFKKFKLKFKPGLANFALGNLEYKSSRKSNYVVNNTDAHAIVLGIAGSKKTEKIVIPNIHYNITLSNQQKPNLVITDPKKQILARTGNIFIENGYEIKVFDFEDSKNSLCWNPLEQIWLSVHSTAKENLTEDNYSSAFEQITEIVNALNWPPNDNTIWVNQAKNVIITTIKFMLLYSLENSKFDLNFFTFANAAEFLNEKTFTAGEWIKITKANARKNYYWNKLANEQATLTGIVPETLSGILTNATNVLLCFSNNLNVLKITSNINFHVKETIRNTKKPWVIFICFPDHKDIFNFLISMLITQIYREAIDFANSLPHQKLEHMLQFYLEEFNSLYIPLIPDWMAISRSRNILFLLVIQSYEQLQKYVTKGKDAATIISQARLTYLLETNSSETLKSFSNALGEKIIQRETRSTNGNNETVSTSEQKETLMSLSEIKYKDPDMTIISSGGSKPMALKLKPAYEYLAYDSYIHKPKIIKLDTKLGWDFKNMRLIEFEQYKPNNNQKILEELLANISKLNKNYCIDFKNEVIKKN